MRANNESPNVANGPLLWHYTSVDALFMIVAYGALMPSNAGDSEARKTAPLLWFSAHQRWEPTATKLLGSPDGRIRLMTQAEQQRLFGCVRFGISAHDERLQRWPGVASLAGFTKAVRERMERYGRRLGASPLHWYATRDEIALAGLRFEVGAPTLPHLELEWSEADPFHLAGLRRAA